MESFDEGIKFVKYILEEVGEYKIYIYYDDFDEMKFKAELKNDLNFSENCYYLKDNPPAFAGSEKTLHLFFERTRFYGINTDGSAHHFRLGVVLPVNVIEFLTNKYSHFELMGNKRLESGLQNKVFYIELMIKEAAKK